MILCESGIVDGSLCVFECVIFVCEALSLKT